MWRDLLVCMLIALVVYAPIVRAACELEHVAALADASGAANSAGDGAVDRGSSDRDACCADRCDVMSEPTNELALAAGLSSLVASFNPIVAPTLPIVAAGEQARGPIQHLPSPPPEPMFRRVPRLLV